MNQKDSEGVNKKFIIKEEKSKMMKKGGGYLY
jgi:hypothetical protein